MDGIKHSFKNWNNFSGRASRSEYFIFQIIYFIVFYSIIGGLTNSENSNGLIILIYIFVLFYFIITFFAVSIRRLHDMNFSGWWVILVNMLIPLSYLFMMMKSYDGKNQWGEIPKY